MTTFEERWESANKWLLEQDITLDNEEDRKYLDKVYSWVMKKDNQFPDEDRGALDQHHINVLADHQFKGIKTHVKDCYVKKEPRYAIVDDEVLAINEQRKEKFLNTNGKILDEQLESYHQLSREIRSTKEGMYLLKELDFDKKIISQVQALLCNPVQISSYMTSRVDIFSIVDVDYRNKKFIREVLKNWGRLETAKYRHYGSYLFEVIIDVENAMSKARLTNRQRECLDRLIRGQEITDYKKDLDSIVNKLYVQLNN